MSRQDANAAFALTSFLYGGNAAYIEDLYARYEADPAFGRCRVAELLREPEGRSGERHQERARAPPGKSRTGRRAATAIWSRRSTATGPTTEKAIGDKIKGKAQKRGVELTSADVLQATRDSLHALMLIRAYRMRGHFHAKLDPLELEPEKNEQELDPRSYGFTEADMDRKIFLDKVLGLEFATMREIVAILRRTYCETLGVEFMHISDPAAEGLDPGAHRRPGQGNHLHARRQARDPEQAGRGRRLREIPRRQIYRHQALRSRRRRIADPGARADHQARRQSRRARKSCSAWRIAAASTC